MQYQLGVMETGNAEVVNADVGRAAIDAFDDTVMV